MYSWMEATCPVACVGRRVHLCRSLFLTLHSRSLRPPAMSSGDPSQKPPQQQRSEEYVYYPPLAEEQGKAAASSPPSYESGKWGTYTMGVPSNPQSHPKNQEAATWEPLPHVGLGDAGDISNVQSEQMAFKQTPKSPVTQYTSAPDNPYITTTPAPSYTGKAPGDVIYDYLQKWRQKFEEISKKAEEMASNVWQHLKTGPNMADTAWGKLSQGTKLLTEGGYEKIFAQTFDIAPNEKLKKSYACYLSTSSGPVAGTLYISTVKIAFCSDRPLSYNPAPGQTAWSYYKVVLPLNHLRAVNPSANPNNPVEKYIEIVTLDSHEFWFMGFVNYDKAVKNLHEALQTR